MDKLPQPVGGEGRFRADAPAFVPGGVSAIFLSSTSDAFQTTSPEKRTCVSPFYSLQSSTFMPPETPSIPTTPRFAAPPYISLAPSTPKTFSYTGTSETINAKSSTNLSTAQVHARTISDVVSVRQSSFKLAYGANINVSRVASHTCTKTRDPDRVQMLPEAPESMVRYD